MNLDTPEKLTEYFYEFLKTHIDPRKIDSLKLRVLTDQENRPSFQIGLDHRNKILVLTFSEGGHYEIQYINTLSIDKATHSSTITWRFYSITEIFEAINKLTEDSDDMTEYFKPGILRLE